MEKKYGDLRSGLVIVVVCLLLYFWLIPAQIRFREQSGIAPDFFPRLLAICGGICGAIIALQSALSLKKAGKFTVSALLKDPEAKVNFKKYGRHAIFLVSAGLYLFSMQYAGFIVSSVLYLTFLLIYFGHSKWLKCLLMSAVYVAVVYLIFTFAFKINFPEGILGF